MIKRILPKTIQHKKSNYTENFDVEIFEKAWNFRNDCPCVSEQMSKVSEMQFTCGTERTLS